MNEIVIFDTSVLVDNQRTRRHSERMAGCPGRIRNSSVVLAELWRGATQPAERHFVRALEESRPVLTPTEKNWLESGKILGKIHADHGFEPRKLRELHFDVLIALTVRSYGAKLITSNRADYELIREYRDFEMEVW
ncbi:MAG TPA: type II toxin-antitoxin system VapC family toxin [Terracidiphilus sp.]|nr:type II toxin-antitoxin system VapC family toxin [Terracidiphilus sp.]